MDTLLGCIGAEPLQRGNIHHHWLWQAPVEHGILEMPAMAGCTDAAQGVCDDQCAHIGRIEVDHTCYCSLSSFLWTLAALHSLHSLPGQGRRKRRVCESQL